MVTCLLRSKSNAVTNEPDVEIVNENETKKLLTRMAIPVYDRDHCLAGCLTILQDHSPIADLIDRIHYEERSYKTILNNLDVGIFTVNRGGYITFFNSEAEKISGYDRRQVLGKPCSYFFGDQATDDMCLFREPMEKDWTDNSRQGKIKTQSGETIPIRANYIPLKNEKEIVIGGLATFHDLTLVRQLDQAIRDRYTFHDMIGKSQEMQKVFEKVSIVAGANATILIEGPTGTGKDLLAKVIHHSSARSSSPFVKVNCAAIPRRPFGIGDVRVHQGCFHGCGPRQARQIQRSRQRNHFSGRNRRPAPVPAGQTFTRAGGPGILSLGKRNHAEGGCTHHLRHQPGIGRTCGKGPVQGGPVLPPERVQVRPAGPEKTGAWTSPF